MVLFWDKRYANFYPNILILDINNDIVFFQMYKFQLQYFMFKMLNVLHK